MNCLCCGKPLRTENTDSGWHKSCIKRFFGTAELPEIAIDEAAFEALAAESTNKGYTVPGVQKNCPCICFPKETLQGSRW